ncbi:MAG: hypothetical protein LQ345_001321, partial [Seirophora villosa]
MEVNGVALVAGAGSGIGRQVALAFSSRGISAIVCADINESAARKTTEECLTLKPEGVPELTTHPLQCDVTDEASVQRMVHETIGASAQQSIKDTSLEEWRRLSECHGVGSFLCVRAVVRAMLEQEPQPMVVPGRKTTASAPRNMSRGSIVILTSLAAETVVLGLGAYASAKKAVKGLVETA